MQAGAKVGGARHEGHAATVQPPVLNKLRLHSHRTQPDAGPVMAWGIGFQPSLEPLVRGQVPGAVSWHVRAHHLKHDQGTVLCLAVLCLAEPMPGDIIRLNQSSSYRSLGFGPACFMGGGRYCSPTGRWMYRFSASLSFILGGLMPPCTADCGARGRSWGGHAGGCRGCAEGRAS